MPSSEVKFDPDDYHLRIKHEAEKKISRFLILQLWAKDSFSRGVGKLISRESMTSPSDCSAARGYQSGCQDSIKF